MNIIDEIKESAKKIKNIIAIGSGKGGVGKSTITANLAIAVSKKGYKTAVLDVDIYGPTIPSFFGIYDQPLVLNNKMIPHEKNGIKLMSLGFLVNDFSAVIWRGPMIMTAIKQFFVDVDWGDVDFMFIDLPPGTGDAPLTIAQALPLKGGLIVTTPQTVAVKTAVRAVDLFKQLKVPVLGAVVNMSYVKCPKCGEKNSVFASNGKVLLKEKTGLEVIAELPFYENFMEEINNGEIRNVEKNKEASDIFDLMAEYVIKKCVIQ
jgi:ATP-binding protein involved in chromosome partitioning